MPRRFYRRQFTPDATTVLIAAMLALAAVLLVIAWLIGPVVR
jgi:hypothetical protein